MYPLQYSPRLKEELGVAKPFARRCSARRYHLGSVRQSIERRSSRFTRMHKSRVQHPWRGWPVNYAINQYSIIPTSNPCSSTLTIPTQRNVSRCRLCKVLNSFFTATECLNAHLAAGRVIFCSASCTCHDVLHQISANITSVPESPMQVLDNKPSK